MVRSIYTLHKVARELTEKLSGSYIAEIFTQEKNSLMMLLVGDEQIHVQFSGGSSDDAVFIRRGFHRAKKNTVDLMPELLDEVLKSVSVLDSNRILKFEFLHSYAYAVLFGGHKSNFFATSENNLIFDALNDADEHTGSTFEPPNNILKKLEDFETSKTLLYALSRDENLFGRQYAEEILLRTGYDGETELGNLNDIDFKKITDACNSFRNELLNSDKSYILENNGDRLFSLLPLSGWNIIHECDSVSECIRRFHVMEIKQDSFTPLYSSMKKLLQREIKKSSNLIDNLQDFEAIRSRAAKNRHHAELIMAKAELNAKPPQKYIISDWDGNELEIALDEKLTLNENAAKLFDKAKNAETQIAYNKKRLPEERNKLDSLEKLYTELENIHNIKELENFQKTVKQTLGHKMQNAEEKREDKFRRFQLSDGYELFVGKNAANNDELTMKFAKPNDIWLHARGTSGSHAVIRMGKEKKPPKQVLEKAASITAYYSGAKNSKYAPVAWTYKKYVRKPKGANPGAVTISREEVIMAEPGIPD